MERREYGARGQCRPPACSQGGVGPRTNSHRNGSTGQRRSSPYLTGTYSAPDSQVSWGSYPSSEVHLYSRSSSPSSRSNPSPPRLPCSPISRPPLPSLLLPTLVSPPLSSHARPPSPPLLSLPPALPSPSPCLPLHLPLPSAPTPLPPPPLPLPSSPLPLRLPLPSPVRTAPISQLLGEKGQYDPVDGLDDLLNRALDAPLDEVPSPSPPRQRWAQAQSGVDGGRLRDAMKYFRGLSGVEGKGC